MRPLTSAQLLKIYSQLSRHHSKDLHLLRSIFAASRAAMTKKHPSWRCGHCHVVMKGTFPRCWKCGSEWNQCNDTSFVPPEYKQAYDQQTGHQVPWNGSSWQSQGSGSRSPRSRGKGQSKRGKKKGGDQHQGKGFGKGQEQVPLPPMMPMMMPYPQHMMTAPMQQPMMPAPMQPPMMDKGKGKGVANPVVMVPPPPPMPATSAMPASTGAQASWNSAMPMMPFPVAPAAPTVPAQQEDAAKEGKAQKNLNRLLKELKKEEDTLSPNLQSMAHEMKKQDEKSNMRGLHSAVRALGDAKDELLEAENARVQLLSQWKHFLQQSVVKWKEFTMNFQASDSAHQASVHAARLAVRRAQRSFDLASKREHIGKEEPWPVSDEEDEAAEDMTVDSKEESAQKIHDGMSSIVASLEELSSSADLLEQRVKRPRTSMGNEETAAAEGSSFRKAGDT